jgi:cellulose synthase/poly-beta-1,6-N-acetylglucosamine synthase-like glycosyltransferase
VTIALEIVLLAPGIVVAVAAVYLLVLALAAAAGRVLPRRSRPPVRTSSRVAVLVPAHDEELTIVECIARLQAQTISRDRYEIVVVADNCTDRTARLAREAGARVLVRDAPDDRGKGRALRFAMDRLLQDEPAVDAIVVVDADSHVDPDLVGALVGAYEAGADVAQGDTALVPDASGRAQLRAVAYLLINRVRPGGRARLGLGCDLQGNGMLLARETLERHPWEAFTSAEDLEYTVSLNLGGVRPVFVPTARVRSRTAPTVRAADLQSERWEGGRLHLVRTRVPALVVSAVRQGRPRLLEVAFGLLVPPLALLSAIAAVGAAIAAVCLAVGIVSQWTLLPWLVSLVSIAAFTLVGLWAGRAPARAYRALFYGPALALRKLRRVDRLVRHRPDSWVRTDRADDEP